jgi:hypothetical protein
VDLPFGARDSGDGGTWRQIDLDGQLLPVSVALPIGPSMVAVVDGAVRAGGKQVDLAVGIRDCGDWRNAAVAGYVGRRDVGKKAVEGEKGQRK